MAPEQDNGPSELISQPNEDTAEEQPGAVNEENSEMSATGDVKRSPEHQRALDVMYKEQITDKRRLRKHGR